MKQQILQFLADQNAEIVPWVKRLAIAAAAAALPWIASKLGIQISESDILKYSTEAGLAAGWLVTHWTVEQVQVGVQKVQAALPSSVAVDGVPGPETIIAAAK